jgi:hypothetical protein
MRTPDGWTVTVVNIDGRDEFRVTDPNGLLIGGGAPMNRRGRIHSVPALRSLLGDRFAQLTEVTP